MPHPYLSGTWAKLERAEQQFADIKRKALGGFEAEHNPVQRQTDEDTRTNHWVWTEGDSLHAINMSLDLGEFFHNLRSCLDHIAWAFARVGVEGRGGSVPFRLTAFPFREQPSDWNSTANNILRDVPERGRAFIERFQPYQRRNRSFNRHLNVISKINNTDKHSLLNIFEPTLVGIRVENMRADTDHVISTRFPDISMIDAKPGTELYRTEFRSSVEVKVTFAFREFIKEPREGIVVDLRGDIPRLLRSVRFVVTKADSLIYQL